MMWKDIQLPEDIVGSSAATHSEYSVIVRTLISVDCCYAIEPAFLLYGNRNINDRLLHAIRFATKDGVKLIFRKFFKGACAIGFFREQMTMSPGNEIQHATTVAFNTNMSAKYSAEPFFFLLLIFLRRLGTIQEVDFYIQAVFRMGQQGTKAKDDDKYNAQGK